MAGIAGRGKTLAGALLAGFALGAPAAGTGRPAAAREAVSAGSVGSAGGMQPERPDLPDLVEAARRQRERVAESRERRGPAPRFTDADLPRGDRNRADRNRDDRNRAGRGGTDPRERPGAGAGEDHPDRAAAGAGRDSDGDSGRDSDGDSGREAGNPPGEPAGARAAGTTDPAGPGDTGADAAEAEEGLSPEERKERAAALREKLLDLEAALATLGVSGLPTAARHPNRFVSAFDAGRLRAELRETRRELAELESGTGARPR